VYNSITCNKFPSITGTKAKIKKHPNERRGKKFLLLSNCEPLTDNSRTPLFMKVLCKKKCFVLHYIQCLLCLCSEIFREIYLGLYMSLLCIIDMCIGQKVLHSLSIFCVPCMCTPIHSELYIFCS